LPDCRDCGKKRLVWVETSKGHVLYELGAPHFVRCPNKNGAADYVPAYSENALTAIEALRRLEILERDAKKMLEGVPEGEPADMVLAALKRKGEE
jgi:hypothetical protein